MPRPPKRLTNRMTPAPRPAMSPLTAREIREAGAPFDPVPETQRGAIGQRLLLVERILRDHGRAYDYRTATLRELRAIEANLKVTPNPNTAPIAAAVPVPPKAPAQKAPVVMMAPAVAAVPLPPPPALRPAASLPVSDAPYGESAPIAAEPGDVAPMVDPSEIAIGAEGATAGATLSADLDAPIFRDAEDEAAPVPALPF